VRRKISTIAAAGYSFSCLSILALAAVFTNWRSGATESVLWNLRSWRPSLPGRSQRRGSAAIPRGFLAHPGLVLPGASFTGFTFTTVLVAILFQALVGRPRGFRNHDTIVSLNDLWDRDGWRCHSFLALARHPINRLRSRTTGNILHHSRTEDEPPPARDDVSKWRLDLRERA